MININQEDCKKARRGTGTLPCAVRIKEGKSFYKTPINWSLNLATDTFDRDYIIARVQDGTFVPFLNTVEFIDNTPDPTTKEYTGGIMRTIRNGKPMFSFEFDNGPLWHADAYTHNGFNDSGVIIVDSSGTLDMLKSVDGLRLMAHPVSDFNVQTRKYQQGDDTPKSIITFQLSDEEAFNLRPAILSETAIGVNLNTEIVGITDVDIAGTASVAAKIKVTVTGGQNTTYGILALSVDNWRVINNTTNAVMPLTSVVPGINAGEYTITPTAALVVGQKVVAQLYDATATPPVATALLDETSLQLYRGQTPELTVVA